MDIKNSLFALRDTKYKDFHSRLIPNTDPNSIIGVRVPLLRKLSKDIAKSDECASFLLSLPHTYYEENNLHAFLIAEIADFGLCIERTEEFLPFIDNWATCDSFRPKCFKNNRENLLPYIENWLKSPHTYTVRFGIEMLMCLFLDDYFDMKYPERIAVISSDEYYINMMIAWYFTTALSKHYEKILPFLEEKRLPAWVHNKTISKCTESFCFTTEQKKYLRTLKIN